MPYLLQQSSKLSESQLLEVTAIKPVHHPQNEIKIACGEITIRECVKEYQSPVLYELLLHKQ
jgi:hypothetical protein